MSTMPSHQGPSRAGARSGPTSTSARLTDRAATLRVVRAASKLLFWAIVGFVVLTLLNTAFGG